MTYGSILKLQLKRDFRNVRTFFKVFAFYFSSHKEDNVENVECLGAHRMAPAKTDINSMKCPKCQRNIPD